MTSASCGSATRHMALKRNTKTTIATTAITAIVRNEPSRTPTVYELLTSSYATEVTMTVRGGRYSTTTTRAPTGMTAPSSVRARNDSLEPRTGNDISPTLPGSIAPVTRPSLPTTFWSLIVPPNACYSNSAPELQVRGGSPN